MFDFLGHGVTGSINSGNVCFPRYHETSSSRNQTPFVYPRHNHFSHHPAPPPTLFPHLASVSYTVPMNIHDASYSHVGPVQSTGFSINPQRPLDDFVPAATLRNHGLPRFRAFPTDVINILFSTFCSSFSVTLFKNVYSLLLAFFLFYV